MPEDHINRKKKNNFLQAEFAILYVFPTNEEGCFSMWPTFNKIWH